MRKPRILALALLSVAGCAPADDSANSELSGNGGGSGGLSGAIFTTTVDGTRVDANIYAAKTDVYLDGGPGATAPQKAAALPSGDYYFQVTDPSGKTVLSSDDITCRRIHFENGQITEVYRGPSGCMHASGSDQNDGALTVQLMPYADTPNNGGEYKAWVTPVGDYTDSFINRYSKTDNFKVRSQTPPPPPPDAAPPPPPPDASSPPPDAPCDAPNKTAQLSSSGTNEISQLFEPR